MTSEDNYSFVYVNAMREVGKRLKMKTGSVSHLKNSSFQSASVARLGKFFVPAVEVQAWNLAKAEYLGASPEGEKRRRERLEGHFRRCTMVFTEEAGCLISHGGVKLTAETITAPAVPSAPSFSHKSLTVAAKQLVKLHWTTAVVHVKSLQFTAGILQPVNKGRLSLFYLSLWVRTQNWFTFGSWLEQQALLFIMHRDKRMVLSRGKMHPLPRFLVHFSSWFKRWI